MTNNFNVTVVSLDDTALKMISGGELPMSNSQALSIANNVRESLSDIEDFFSSAYDSFVRDYNYALKRSRSHL